MTARRSKTGDHLPQIDALPAEDDSVPYQTVPKLETRFGCHCIFSVPALQLVRRVMRILATPWAVLSTASSNPRYNTT